MDSILLTKALNFHGQELFRAIEDEQGSEKLRVIDMRTIDYHEYRKRAKEFGFQDRQRRQKMLRFIARKADIIYKSAEKEQSIASLDSESDELCAVMPPIESFMGVPAPERKKYYYESAAIYDIAIGQVVRKGETMALTLNLICLDGGKKREVIDLSIKLHCQGAFLPPSNHHENIMDSFQINDYVRVILTTIPPSANVGKLVVSMRSDIIPFHFKDTVKLGVITEEEIPSHHKRYLINQGKPYSEILEHTLGFNNPATCAHLCKMLGISQTKNHSFMRGLQRLDKSTEDNAVTLRKEQSSKWAYKSVRDGVAFFKAGNHTEAFQCLNKALQIDPQNVEAFVARGALFANNNNLRRALEDFDEALAINPNHLNGRKYTSETLVALGRYYEEKGEVDAAYKTYKKSVQIYANNAAGREALISLDVKEKKRQQEKELLAQRALKASPPPPSSTALGPDTRDKLKLLLKEEKKWPIKTDFSNRSKKGHYKRDSESNSPSHSWSSYSPPPRNRSRERDSLGSPTRERYTLLTQAKDKPREKDPYPVHHREKEPFKVQEEESSYWRAETKKVEPEPFDYEEEFEKFEKKLNKPLKEEKYYRKESPVAYFEEKPDKKRRYSPEPEALSPSPKKEVSLRDRIKMFYEKHSSLEDRHETKGIPRKSSSRQENVNPTELKSKWNFSDDNDSEPNNKTFSKKTQKEENSRPTVQEVRVVSPPMRLPSPKVVFVMRKDDDLHYSKIYTHSAFKDEEEDDESKAAKGEGKSEKKDAKVKSVESSSNLTVRQSSTFPINHEQKEKSKDFKDETKTESKRKERSYRRVSSSSGDSSDDSSDSGSSSSGSTQKKRKRKHADGDSPYKKKKRSYDDRDDNYRKDSRDRYYEGKDRHYDKYKDGKYNNEKYRDYKKPYPYYKNYHNDNHNRGSYKGANYRPNFRRPMRGRGFFRGRRPFNHKQNNFNDNFVDKKRGPTGIDDEVVISRAPDIEMLKRLKESRRKEKEGSAEPDILKLSKAAATQNWSQSDSSLNAVKAAAKKINESIQISDDKEEADPGRGKQSLQEMESFLEKLKNQKKDVVK